MLRQLLLGAVLAASPQSPPAASLPLTTLPLRLTGVAADTAPHRSACLIRCTDLPGHGIYSPGQLACGVAVIEDIHPQGVVVRNVKANRREWLTFGTASDPKPSVPTTSEGEAQPPVSARAAPSPLTIQVSKTAVASHLANLSDVLASALAVPHYRESGTGRVMDGFEISRVAAGGAADAVGLRDGDVVLEVNGQPLNSMGAVVQLLGEARSLAEARVVLSRGGERVPLVITVK
jgi:type II secretory pathway component PulC